MRGSLLKRGLELKDSDLHFYSARRIFLLVVLVVFYIVSVLIHLDCYPLNGDEPRRAIVTIEMRHSGDFITPTTLGWKYYNKPPLYNWIIGASMFLTGSEGEISIRLPSLIALLLWGACIFSILKNIIPFEVAALSSIFFVTSFDIFFWGLNNGGEIDILYSFITYLQIISIYYFNQRKNWIALFITSYLFCALGFLTKGFPSLLFQVLSLIALCTFNKSLKVLFKWQHMIGIVVFFAFAGGYFYVYSLNNSYTHYLVNLMKESLDKSLVGDYSERLVRKIIEYPISLFKILLPWSLLLLLFLKKHQYSFWSYPFIKFSLLFILFNIPVYWFTGHPRMRYSYVFVPFFMNFLAFIFYEFRKNHQDFIKKIFGWGIRIFLILSSIILFFPLMKPVNHSWYLISIVAIVLYFYSYTKSFMNRVVQFATGIILFRFLYASLYVPYWSEHLNLNYKKEMAVLAARNQRKPVNIYYKPDTLDLSINLKFAKFHYDSIPAIPYLTYQIPYYYYRNSGQIVKFDTVLNDHSNYISFRSEIADTTATVLYSFYDRNYDENAEIVLFRLNNE